MSKRKTPPKLNDPLESYLGYQLRRASLHLMSDLYERLESLKLTPAMASTLLIIGKNPGVKLIDIGFHLAIRRANMTPMVAKLEDMGLVKRLVTGRAHALSLSEAGELAAEKVKRSMDENEALFWRKLNSAERDFLHTTLVGLRLSDKESSEDA